MTTKAPETTPEAVDAIRANVMTLATLDAIWVPIDDYAAVVAERDALREALVEANDLLRSTMQIAARAIQHEEFRVLANWDAFHDRVAVHLKRRQQITNEARAELAKQEQMK